MGVLAVELVAIAGEQLQWMVARLREKGERG